MCFVVLQINKSGLVLNNTSEVNENNSSEDETPPSPPPRSTSCQQPPARPLPNIPKSSSLNDILYEDGESMEEVSIAVLGFRLF